MDGENSGCAGLMRNAIICSVAVACCFAALGLVFLCVRFFRYHLATQVVRAIYSAPIAFYGKAQDQDGNAIAGAAVEFSAVDKMWAPGTKHHAVTDESGRFSLTGARGAGLHVAVSKDGYGRIYKQSDGHFSYGFPFDPQRDRPTPTEENPAVFILRKKQPAEPLIVVTQRDTVPQGGNSLEVSLRTAKSVAAGTGDVKFEVWADPDHEDEKGHYPWKMRFSVPGGGLMKRQNVEWSFIAPETGYQESLEFQMPATEKRWVNSTDGQFWLKLRDGTYARAHLRLTGGGHAVAESYWNPSGSRNLEYDKSLPANQVIP